ncbi:FtsX-like permease family protein [Clostridium sp. Marseille-P299]|uniref:FtsX-like permease family protein n=1 Tax=Clostridium sp. Marseille-P299 TaxID=1805477 RepID=UPI0008362120|nr:ABC transporter permease [Clostridium sp. Marseille-P299]
MKLNVLFRSTIRQPVRSVLLFLLVGAISFLFVSRAVEYFVINQEVERISAYYRAIATLHTQDTDDVTNGISIVKDSKYVAFDDNWRMSTGVLQGLYNPDIDGTSSDYPGSPVSSVGLNVSDILIYGTIDSKEILEIPSDLHRLTETQYQVNFKVDYVEAGYPERVRVGQLVTLSLDDESEEVAKELYESLNQGVRYFLRAYYNPDSKEFRLKPIIGELWAFPVQAGETIDFSSDEWADFANEVAVLKENQSTMLVVGLKDMSAQPMVQPTYSKEGRYYLVDGRWLNMEDNNNANRVCMVRQEFAQLRGLSVGDRITLTMRELKTLYYGYIIFGEDWDHWENYDTYTETFEIAGIYNIMTTSSTGLTSRNLRVFIPDSCMPVEIGILGNTQSSYSFVLNSPRDIQSFTEETSTALSAIGMRAVFMDNGWETFNASTEPILSSTSLNALVSGLTLILALLLAVFLYLRGRRHDFAILRALGVSKKATVFWMLLPMLVIGGGGTIISGVLSWRYTLGKVFKTLASLKGSTEFTVSASLPLTWLALLCISIVAFMITLTFFGVLSLASQPVLMLLLNTGSRVKQNKKVGNTVNEIKEDNTSPVRGSTAANIVCSIGKNPESHTNLGFAQITRYVFHHIVRAPLKTCLAIVLPMCSIAAIGWIHQTIVFSTGEVARLYETTVVTGDIIKGNTTSYNGGESGSFIRKQTIDDLVSTGYIKDMYVESAAEAVVYPMIDGILQLNIAKSGIVLYGFDRPEHFFSGSGKNIKIEYSGSISETLFTKKFSSDSDIISTGEPPPAVLPKMLMERLSVQIGNVINIESGYKAYTFRVAGQYSEPIAGNLGSSVETILMPLSMLTLLKEGELLYISAEFVIDPAKNRDLASFREEAESIVMRSDAGVVELRLLLWDEELTKVVGPLEKNIELLTVLYPVVVVVSTLIAIVLSLLLITQRSKETAIMRILGATKLRVRIALTLEQAILCLTGAIIGLILVTLLNGSTISLPGSVVLCAFVYFAGTLLGAVVGAGFAVERSPLELLQVKE